MLTIERVRGFLNDYPASNRLLKQFEFSQERISNAIQTVVSEWNETPPITSKYTPESYPYDLTLLYGVCAYLLQSEALTQERNHLTYQSGGLTVDDSNHANAYLSLSNLFFSKYKELMTHQKTIENAKMAWSYIPSPYYGRN